MTEKGKTARRNKKLIQPNLVINKHDPKLKDEKLENCEISQSIENTAKKKKTDLLKSDESNGNISETTNIVKPRHCRSLVPVGQSMYGEIDDNNNTSGSVEKTTKCEEEAVPEIPEVLKKQGTASYCSNAENTCPCNTMEDVEQISKQVNVCNRRSWITVDRLNELRKRAQDAIKHHKTFTIRGCFFSVRNALVARGWVEKLDAHRKHAPHIMFQMNYEDITQGLPKRRPGESRRQYLIKCERNVMSRFLEHTPIDFLWTARKEKCDWIDQAKNPLMVINKFHRVPFTTKEGICGQLRDFHWCFEDGVAEVLFPRCYNVWSPEELNDFTENFRLTGCISLLKWVVHTFRENGFDSVFSSVGKIPSTAMEFAVKRCAEFLENCNHNDIDNDEPSRVWDHDWDAFLTQHYTLTNENGRIQIDSNRIMDPVIKQIEKLLQNVKEFWPQYDLDGYLNIWIVKPANKCRGRGIHLMSNFRKILNMVNPSIATKSRFVVQKYIERPLIIHNTKFDVRQWFLVTNVQPLVIWMYKESYMRFSSQEYNLENYHESVHLTNHAIQKKYRNARRDKRLPSENMWDCYTFQAYLRQIGEQSMWDERIYPGMRKAIVGAMLASQDNMDRRSNTFELFGADFLISEDFHPWLIEINSSPDLGGTTSVTARMCPECLEDVIKVVIDRRFDPKAETGSFELIYRQVIPPTPAYMGLNLFLKGRQVPIKPNAVRREKSSTALKGSINHLSHYSSNQLGSASLLTSSGCHLVPGQKGTVPVIVDFLEVPSKEIGPNDMVFKQNSFYPHSASSCGNLLRSNTTLSLSNSRLLTPLVPCYRHVHPEQLSSTRSSTSQRPFTENSIKQNSELKPKSNFVQSGARRRVSCGPKLIAADTSSGMHPQIALEANTVEPKSRFECIGNKYNIENGGITENETVLKTSPRTAKLASRQQFFELLYKSKSARIARPTRAIAPTKLSSRANSNSANKRSSASPRKKLGNVENKGAPNMKNPNVGCISSPFHTVGMSLRAWKSRQYKIMKDSRRQSISLVSCKSAPVVTSPKRQLCKNLSKKLSGQSTRINTRC